MRSNKSSLAGSTLHSAAHRQAWYKRLRPAGVRGWAAGAGLVAMALASFMVVGQSGPPSIPALALATEPLFGASTNEKPAIALALSVEYPTVGAQYRDATYSPANEYLGYYDAEACYTYNNAPTETPRTGLTTQDYKRFDRTGAATARKCTGEQFSGNFLNWASNSAIDMLRMALSGGDRYIDEENLTVLQRAILPNAGGDPGGDNPCFWNNGSHFPAKQLTSADNYSGAVPASMRTSAGSQAIWVANKLNQIYFRAGASSAGSCTDSSGYTLGAPSTASPIGPRTNYLGDKKQNPSDSNWTLCAGNVCTFTGVRNVLYVERTGSKSKDYKYWSTEGPVDAGVQCNRANLGGGNVFPKDSTIFCYINEYNGSWTPPSSGLNTEGYFFSRVQVCNSTGGTLQDVRDYGLCKKYPSGYFKPTGAIQKYSDQLRLAAFGYLMDQSDPKSSNSTASFGGVLRAPMKYVGDKLFDISGQYSGSNTKAEWNQRTGQFVENPENNTTVSTSLTVSSTGYSSGVINYLNKFGRTGTTYSGRYKTRDPVGELHYETVRYLQGLAPTTLAVSKITGTNDADFVLRDGFPAYTTWADPYGDGRSATADYSCVKSNIVVVGDVNTHDGNRFPSADVANNVFNATSWRDVVVNFEKNTTSTYVDGQGINRTTGNPNGANTSVPNSNDRSKLMGSAYWAHTHDIRGASWTSATDKQRPGLRVKTFLFDVNENGGSTAYSNRSTNNQFFMAAKYGGFENDPSNLGGNPYNTYGNPFINEKTNTNSNKVWQDVDTPARAAEASTYYLQSSARDVLKAFDDIFNRASTKARSIAKRSSNSTSIKVGSATVAYGAKFDTGDWSGDVEATEYALAADGTLSETLKWSAATQLGALTSPVTSRNIVIGTNAGAVDFSPSTTFSFLTANEVRYLRGERSLEGQIKDGSVTWRKRSSLLGDVVNSGVVYSGAPSRQMTGDGYKDFYDDNKNRTPTVFAGANDGMLHAFNATTGDELFAFIPKTMAPKLASLTQSTFITGHQNFVDGLLAVKEVSLGTSKTKADWKTVLLGANGGGARSVFALDVTNPSDFGASKVLWEFTSADDADLGYVIGQPQMLKLRTSATDPTYKWFAVVASGVNNYIADTGGNYSSTGKPALFLLSLDKAATASWVLNTNYYKISLPIDSSLLATRPTGLANFTPILGFSGEVREIFMGDYYGNLWNLQFNTRGTSVWKAPADWSLLNLSPLRTTTDANPLYVTKDTSSNRQVIHEAPMVLGGPMVEQMETFFIFAGTGKFNEPGDKSSTNTNSIFAVFDNGTTKAEEAITGRSQLKGGTINATAKTVTVDDFVWGRLKSTTDLTKTTTRAGWYADFPVAGERVVGVIQGVGRKAIFNTIIPATAGASGGCGAGTGTTNTYIVDIPSGAGNFTSKLVLEPPSLVLQNDSDSAQTVSVSDPTGRSVRAKKYIIPDPNAPGGKREFTDMELMGRLSWRQINNYLDLKNKANP
ncbi:PilC/PilY family type IV pilus protein [Pseudomonas sp.]|uniref:pilus assembly protein n=1 Tax=Pseudomonas sp. TaxID=306 RepID=UPI0023542039|nr:PilC/PilY family type IV pilus protein [Pseudomonas sp.]